MSSTTTRRRKEVAPLERQGMSPEEFGLVWSLSTPSVVRGCRRGEIEHFKIGNRIIIPISENDRMRAKAKAEGGSDE
jgi:hypothetical protein